MPEDLADPARERPEQDREAFGALLESYRNPLNAFAEYRMPAWLKAHVPPMDVVQDALLAVIQALQDPRPPSKERQDDLYGYCLRVLTHKIVDRIRSTRRLKRAIDRTQPLGEIDLPTNSPTPGTKAARNEFDGLRALVMPELSERDRRVLAMYLDQGLAQREIAAELGITPQAARAAIQRAVRHLRRAMGMSDRSTDAT